jgi:hypothetical protein
LHDTKVKKKDDLVLKLDFEKAYDKINWDFLFSCIEKRGFDGKWCKWIQTIISSAPLAWKWIILMVLILQLERGYLSPFLFNNVVPSLRWYVMPKRIS